MSNPGDEHIRKYIFITLESMVVLGNPDRGFQVEANVNIITCLLDLEKRRFQKISSITPSFMATAKKDLIEEAIPFTRKIKMGHLCFRKFLQNVQIITEEGME